MPPDVDRWIALAGWLRGCDALAGWLGLWAVAACLLPNLPLMWTAALAFVPAALASLFHPLRALWRPVSGAVGLAISRSLRPGDRAWYVRSHQASPVLVTARRGIRMTIAGPEADEPDEVLRVRRTRVLLLPADRLRPR